MPGSRGLFARAIIQSGSCSDALYFDVDRATAQAEALAEAVGCRGEGTLACLREKSAETITTALPGKRGLKPPGVWWGPVVDGIELPREPLHAMRDGAAANVPLLIGWNRDEGSIHTVGTITSEDVESFVQDTFGPDAVPAVLAKYTRSTWNQALSEMFTDGVMACNARRVARVLAGRGIPVFLYEWTRVLDSPKAHALGATHTVELFFLWGNADNGIALSDAELPLSRAMMEAWGRFARSGHPRGPAVPWESYDIGRDELMQLDLQPTRRAHVKRGACDFWDDVEARGARARRAQSSAPSP